MSFSFLLIGLSLALFAYWFRYTCLLILRTQTAEDYASEVCRVNGLRFDQVKGLIGQTDTNLDELYRSLERDYRIVSQLMEQVSGSSKDDNALQNRLLTANFRVSQAFFRVSRTLGLGSSAKALEEMADTIGHFANNFGQFSANQYRTSGASA